MANLIIKYSISKCGYYAIMNTIVVNNVYRKFGEPLMIILKVLALDLPDSVKTPHSGSKKRYLSISVNISPNSLFSLPNTLFMRLHI